jgi:hypothetical protein
MGSRDAAEALAEGQRAARSATPEWGRATPQKLWPKANAQLGAQPQNGIARRRKGKSEASPASPASDLQAPRQESLAVVSTSNPTAARLVGAS